jgi:NAD(P)-dependent dehydrogenase (short-subunit alcohol dehydrogenase family)
MTPGIALVTGAGARLGRAMALALGADGWKVAVHFHSSREGADETCEMIRKAGGTAEAIQADLSDEADRGELVARAAAALGGPISLLINSASTFQDDTLATHSRKNWDFHMEPNLRAPIHLAQQMASALPESEKGLVINMIDQRVWKLNPVFFTYTLSKAALWQATQTMAQALAPNIRVNGIGPGPTLASVHQTAEEFEAEKAATLTGEGSSPDEIVRAMRYLVSASSVTGQMIASDGGQHLMWQTPDVNI